MKSKEDIEAWLAANLPPEEGESEAAYLIRAQTEFNSHWNPEFEDYALNAWETSGLETAMPDEPMTQPKETMQWAVEYSTLTKQSSYSRRIAEKLGIPRSTLYNWLKKVIEI